jgi:serine protease Do
MFLFLSVTAQTEESDMAIAGFGDIAEQLRRSTVLIHAGGRGNGSGVIWSSEGMIVTNGHVVHGPNVCVQLWDGREFEAAVTARDPRRDLAALRINANSLPAACPADSSQLRPGELAIAIGNPLGFVGALTTGVIHAIGPLRALGSQTWVQASVRLAPGNSGGPLADARGHVIGVNTMVAGRLALAIPSNAVRDFLAAGPRSAWLGVAVHPVRLPRANGHKFGLVLLEVEPGSPAAQASLMAGDILLGTEEKPFQSIDDLAKAMDGQGLRLLRLEFLRGEYSRVRRVTVRLGDSSEGKDRIAA